MAIGGGGFSTQAILQEPLERGSESEELSFPAAEFHNVTLVKLVFPMTAKQITTISVVALATVTRTTPDGWGGIFHEFVGVPGERN
jgi:hypothetical protein